MAGLQSNPKQNKKLQSSISAYFFLQLLYLTSYTLTSVESFHIRARNGKMVQIKNSKITLGSRLTLAGEGPGPDQDFYLKWVKDDYYAIGLYADQSLVWAVKDSKFNKGQGLHLEKYNGGRNQQFKLNFLRRGRFKIESAANGNLVVAWNPRNFRFRLWPFLSGRKYRTQQFYGMI